MAIRKAHYSLAIIVILLVASVTTSQNVCDPECKPKEPFNCDNTLTFNRTAFPKNFIFGAATSAYQIEGAAHRAFNGWDYFTHRYPEKVPDRSSGDLACNSYDLYKDDVKILKKLNAQAYRFSIAWSRVLPKGRLIGGIDEKGIAYYNNLINELKANGIEPYVTIFHWDVPQALEDEYGGFLSPRIVEDFKNYAELLFQRFGDRVKFWITLNQPFSFASKGYGDGSYPPGRCTDCEFGDSATEPYIAAHHQLLAHAESVAVYRKRYQKFQGGKIGTTLIGRWFVPLNKTSISDHAAAKRAFDFIVGWYLDPLVYGDYPQVMKDKVRERLPRFTPQESEMIKGSLDFLGLNYYVTQYATDAPPPLPSKAPHVLTDPRVTLAYHRNGVPIGIEASCFVYYPPGFREKVPDRSSGDLACDSYDLYKDDVQLLKKLNVQAYRFSIAWSRVLPKGRLIGGIDENGITYYNNLINELKKNGIEPYVTIFHWDVPQTLEDEYGGFLSPRIVEDYKNYAELLFKRFGDRVKFWITLNQPYSLATKGYGDGSYPPGRCTDCEFGGNSGTEPYIVAHHQLLAHAEAVSLYRKRYQKFQGGKIGTTLIGRWFVPLNITSPLDNAAAKRAFDFIVGWFLDPLVYGDYPKIMKEIVGERLPSFTPQESELVKGSLDFLGLNYYVTQYATDAPPPLPTQPNALTDPRVTLGYYRNGVPIGVVAPSFVYYPPGFRNILNYIKHKYKNPLTYITENGVADYGNQTLAKALADTGRIQCHCSHLSCLKCSIEDGSNVAGYFAWSSMDNYEFGNGYTLRFGMNWVNFTNPADRKQKDSGKWFSKFIAK